jgi:hypothetical protein
MSRKKSIFATASVEKISEPVKQTLINREKTHGSFANNAKLMQTLKKIVRHANAQRGERKQQLLSDVQMECAEMIVFKLARILTGDPSEVEHWHDIAGYASLSVADLAGIVKFTDEDFEEALKGTSDA